MRLWLLIITLLVSIANIGCNGGERIKQSQEGVSSRETTEQIQAGEKIQWVYSLSDGLKIAAEKKRPLMVDFYADWCGWCKRLDKETYNDSEVIRLSNRFVCVKVNTDRNPDEARRYKISGLPTILFLDPTGEIIEKVIGYRDSKDFVKIMSAITEE